MSVTTADDRKPAQEHPSRAHAGTRICFWVALLLSPLSLVSCLSACDAVNPMLLGFLVETTVNNSSGSDVQLTPVGIWEDGRSWGILPQYLGMDPPAIHQLPWLDRRLSVAAGQSVTIVYDWDDINIAGFVLETEGGPTRFLEVNPDAHVGCCAPPRREYTIPALTSIPEQRESNVDLDDINVRFLMFRIAACTGWLFPWMALRCRRRLRVHPLRE